MDIFLSCGTPTAPNHLSLATPRNVIDQLEIGRSQLLCVEIELFMVLLKIIYPTLAQLFVEFLILRSNSS